MAEFRSLYSQHIYPQKCQESLARAMKNHQRQLWTIEMINQLHKRNSTRHTNSQTQDKYANFIWTQYPVKTYAKFHKSQNPKRCEIKLGVFHGWQKHGIESITENIKTIHQLIGNSQPNFYPLRIPPPPKCLSSSNKIPRLKANNYLLQSWKAGAKTQGLPLFQTPKFFVFPSIIFFNSGYSGFQPFAKWISNLLLFYPEI